MVSDSAHGSYVPAFTTGANLKAIAKGPASTIHNFKIYS